MSHQVLTPEDVSLAIENGVDGILISNHGGRQLDGVPATLDALRECVPVAKGKIKLAVDGGIRRGSDIFKALALGAHFVLAGRPPLWGLAAGTLNSSCRISGSLFIFSIMVSMASIWLSRFF